MEEIEVPEDNLMDNMQEKALERRAEKEKGWSMYVVISSALMAVVAALASALAGHHSDEALISQIKASDQWAYYQSNSIKYEIILNGQAANTKDGEMPTEIKKKMEKYSGQKEQIMDKAKDLEKESEWHLAKHVTFARAVTLFQISIAVCAISMLSGRKALWFFSLVLSAIGLVFLSMGFI